jgi:hypothetical protein
MKDVTGVEFAIRVSPWLRFAVGFPGVERLGRAMLVAVCRRGMETEPVKADLPPRLGRKDTFCFPPDDGRH